MLGNPEYNLAGTMAELPASLELTDEEQRRSSWEGLFGVARPVNTEGYVEGQMGGHDANRDVQVRQGFHVTQVFNARLRRPGESPWVVEKR